MSLENKLETFTSWTTLSLAIVILCLVQLVRCQDATGDTNQFDNPETLALITRVVYGRLSNLSAVIQKDVGNQSSFCIKDWDADWDRAFDFSSNLDFLSSCIQKTNGDITRRVCTAAEMKFYLNSFFENPGSENYLKPNKNCNLTSWVSGCEPGWACSVNSNQQVNLNDAKVIPARTLNCQACCEGFFCPDGITCMIPCPLGSYCPLAKLNKTTGVCEPYLYQLPPGQPNHTCGGANIWADVGSSSELFCSAGSFCPTTTRRNTCSKITAGWVLHPRKAASSCLHAIQTLRNKTCKHMELCFWERRLAKSREAAARSARETATARQKWKTAKDAAKKHASGLQAHLSRTFSRKKDFTHPEKLKILDQVKSDDDPIQHPSTSGSVAFLSSRVTSVEKKTEPSDLLRIMQEIEDDPDGCQGFNVGTGDKNMNIPVPKGKQTHTQIFSYAYSQLEKEKAQQEDNEKLTFSGIVKLATNAEIRKRPLLEISFKNLTLTLKAKNKHLLRCVTGEIKPGRITAVMGPSGAGKTTFLSAVAGKAIGCKMTGLILINGKNESIHSYKKIVGFVPQDDVVHGNLTVEENLWFSAKCRLSTDLSERDKVLVVERVIEFLGLQTVRSSLVGTVEKRGISGGQRKRVNVGLEMVMEPSLLILDEPTSGLDSASSLQLLRALRREALEGVNICMVVHQPSYALFKMFDDLILLAKGGLTVYQGPVKKVEEYFTGLGINIPERVNPPDHFIDILEGIVVPAGSSRVSYKDLPVRWMLHNLYSVPLDMQQNNAALSRSSMDVIPANETNPSGAGMEDHSFAREIWQGMKSNVVLQRDKLHLNFLRSKDLTNRRTPGAFQQYRYFLGRVGKQRLREARILAMDYLILLLAGACLGSLVKVKDQSFGADAYTYTIIAVSLLCKIAALRSFSLDKLHYWRESASGISSLAYFLSKDTIDHFNTVIKPAVYLSMFYFFTNPRSSFADNYIVLFCLVYCVTGIAYSLAIVFEPGTAQLCSVLLPVVLTLIATQPKDSEFMKILANLCYPKWALEAFVTANAERYYGVWLITRCGSLLKSGYNVHDWHLCIAILVSIGLVCRVIAFICMLIFQKK
ncbi:ABC transporter G family member 24-like isoform X1 [Carya illinoinensis]|uniref:ABC transporter G family member 24-like isoform X1 n=1 Tax=Carya illinoinensis TaxID=32201 RepID=UPI001C724BC6|nr:ABC transporter G family member 24-like isoform X1 [Carya illinoinensis]